MKKKLFTLLFVAVLTLVGTKGAFAASGWQSLGTWTISNGVTVTSKDGGNMKVRVNGTTSKYSFKVVKDVPGNLWGPTKTTSGVSGDNSAIFSVSKGAKYKVYLDSPRGGSINITILD